MDGKRAQQIVDSRDNIEVLFDGTPVWIERIDENNTAHITYLESNRKQVVPLYKLVEVNPVDDSDVPLT